MDKSELQEVMDRLVVGGVYMWVTTAYGTKVDGIVRIDAQKEEPEPVCIVPGLDPTKVDDPPMSKARLIITSTRPVDKKPIAIEVYYNANGFRDGKLVWGSTYEVDDAVAFVLADMLTVEQLKAMRS